MVAAISNDAVQAQSIIYEIEKTYPLDTFAITLDVPSMEAELELHRGNGAAAEQLLDPTRRFYLGLAWGIGNVFLRGSAYLQQRMAVEAANEFQKILSRRGVDLFSVVRQLASRRPGARVRDDGRLRQGAKGISRLLSALER